MASTSADTILFEVEVQTDSSSTEAVKKVDDSVSSLEKSFQDLQKRQATNSAQLRAGTLESAQQAGDAAEDAAQDMRQLDAAQEQVASSSQTVTSAASTTSTQLGFELVSAAQDAQFGMAGVANQIPLIAEQFGQLKSQTGSTTGALTSLLSTFTGPTGILAVGTLALQALPSIIDFFSGVEEGADKAERQVQSLTETVAEINQQTFGDFEDNPEARSRVLTALRREEERLQQQRGQQFVEGVTGSPEALETLQSLKAVRNVIGIIESQADGARKRVEALLQLGLPEDVAQDVARQSLRERDDSDDEEAPTTLAPPVEPQQVESAQLVEAPTVDLDAQLQLFTQIKDQIDLINAKPFLDPGQKSAQRVEAVTRRVRELQDAGALLSRGGITDFLRQLDLTEKEAQQVRQALTGVKKEAQQLPRLSLSQAFDVRSMGLDQIGQQFDVGVEQAKALKKEGTALANQFENQLASAAGQFGASMVSALDDGKISAGELLSSLTQVASTLLTTFGGPAGAALGPIVGSLGSLFDTGGYTGDRPADAPAGIVHGREYVFSADATQGNVQELGMLHEMMEGGISLGRLYEVAGVPGYDTGGYVGAMTQPATTVSVSTSGGGGQQAVQQAADEAARRTADRVADALANRPNYLQLSPGDARDILETGQEYSSTKSPRPS